MKKAIIIGATSGIGRELAKILAQNDYLAGIAGRRVELLASLQKEIPAKTHIKRIDVTQTAEAVGFLDELIKEMDGVDLVVISAGVGHINPDLNWELEKEAIDVNVAGFTALAGVVFRHLIQQRSGHLVGISSIGAIRGAGVFTWIPDYTQAGSYEVTFKATTNGLSDTKTITITVNNVDRAPVLTLPGNQAVNENQLLTFTLSATDPDGDVINYSMTPVPTGAALDSTTGVFSWMPDYTQSGNYTITFTATANLLTDAKTITITVNNIDRAPILTSPGNQTVNENQLLTFTLSAIDPDGDAIIYSMALTPTGANLNAITGIFSWTPDYDQSGSYEIAFKATANSLSDTKTVTITVNNVDRAPVLASPGNQTVNENQLLTFTLSATDPDGDVISYSMMPAITGAILNETTGAFSWMPDYTQSGSYEVTFKATANGLSDTKVVTITVNNVDRAPVLVSPGNKSVNENQLLTFTLSATDPDGDATTYLIEAAPTGATLDAATGVFSWTPDYTQAGSYEVTFKATANSLVDTKTITIIINNVDRAPVLASPGNQTVNESQLLTFILSSNDPDGDNITYSMIPVPTGATLDVATGAFAWTPDYTQAGSYEVTFKATANSLSDTKTVTITVNNVDRAPVLVSPGNQVVNEGQLLTFTLSATDPDGDTIVYSMSPVPAGAALDTATGVFSWTPDYGQTGNYTVTFVAAANGLTDSKVIIITVGDVDRPPVLTSPGNKTVNENQLLTFTLLATDPDSDAITYSMTPAITGAVLNETTGVFSWTPDYTQAGSYEMTFKATSNSLSDTKTVTITVNNVDRAPVLTSPGNKSVNENQLLTFTLSATDPDGDAITYSMTPAITGAVLNETTGAFSWTPDYTQAGIYEVTFKATSNNLSDTKTVTITVNNVDRAPVLVSPGNQAVDENQLLTFMLSATDPDGNTIAYSMASVPTGATLDAATGVFSWIPDYTQAGSYEVAFKATANGMSDTKTVTITVNNVDRSPVLTSPGNQSVNENQLLTFTLSATDPDGDTVAYSMTPVIIGAALNADTGEFIWTPDYDQSGSYEVTFKATANGLSDTKTVIVTANNVDRAPVLVSPDNKSVNEDQLLTFTLSATDLDGDSITYSMTPVPTGAVLNEMTGVFTWTPDYTQAGSYTVTFTATANLLTDTKTITITVDNVDRSPVLASPGNQVVNEAQLLPFILSATDPDGDAITYSMTPTPTGADLNVTTGIFLWTPDYDQAGSYEVIFKATANGLSDTKTVIITVNNIDRAPVLVSPGNQAVNENQLLTFTLLAMDPDGDAITYSMTSAIINAVLDESTGVFNWMPDYTQAGSYEVIFKATAKDLSDTKTVTITVNNVDRAPVLTSPGNQAINENQLLTFILSAADPDGDVITYSIMPMPVGAILDSATGLFNWTPDYNQSGNYGIIFNATANGLSDSKTITITVNNVDRAPVLTSPGNQVVNENQSLTFALSAVDPDGDIVTYSMESIPVGAMWNSTTGIFDWTPGYTQAGSYDVTFMAMANGLSDSKTITITVNNVDQAPALSIPGNQIVDENQILIFTIFAADPDGDVVTYSMDPPVPTGAVLNPATGEFIWQPDYTQAGSYEMTFRAASNLLVDTRVMTIMVNNVDRSPVLVLPGNQTVDENQLLTFALSATDPDGDIITYSMMPMTAGANLDPITGVFSWTPDYTQAGNYDVTFMVTANGLSDTQTVIIIVNNVDRAPVLVLPGNQSVDANQFLTFTVSAVDPDGDAVTYSMEPTPIGATLDPNTGLFNWTPQSWQEGSYDLTFIATANGLFDSKMINIKVLHPIARLEITNVPVQAMVGQWIFATVRYLDAQNLPVTVTGRTVVITLTGPAIDQDGQPLTSTYNLEFNDTSEVTTTFAFTTTGPQMMNASDIVNPMVFMDNKSVNVTNAPMLVAKTGGDNQQGLVNTMLSDRFSVRLTDAFSNPVPQMSTIEFQVIKGSGLFADPPSKTELEKAYNDHKGKNSKVPVKSEQPKFNGYQLPYEATGTEFRIKDNPVSPNLKITSSQPIHLWLTAVANAVSLHIEPLAGSAGQADITVNGIGDFFKTTDTIYSHQDGAFQKSFDTRKKIRWTQDLSAKHHVYFMASRGTIEIGQNTILTSDIMDNIVVTADNITIDGNGHAITSPMPGTGYGIYLNGHSNVTIKNFYIYNFQVGIWCDGGGNNKFLNNRIIDAIGGYYSTYGIEFTGSVSNTVNNNKIWNTTSGIHVCMDAVSNILTNNEITLKTSGMDGIWLISANGNTVANNSLTNGRGICLYAPCTGNVIANNTFSNNSAAMDIWGASDNSIRGNIINNCAGSAIQVKSFTAWPNTYYPRHNQIAENAIQNSAQAIYLENSDSNYISYNTANSNYYGLYLANSPNNYVFQNNFFYNYTRNVWSNTPVELSFNNQGNYWGHDYPLYFIPGGDSNRSDVVDSYAQGSHVMVMQNRCAVTVGPMGDATAFWPFQLGELGNDTCVIQAYARGINPLTPEVIPVFFTVKSFYDILPAPVMTSARVVSGTVSYTLEGIAAKGYGYQVQIECSSLPVIPALEVEPFSGKWKTWPMALTEGVYNFTMQTMDTINLQYSTVVTDSFTVDMTPPGVTINSLLPNPISIYSLNLSATAIDAYTTITRAEYWIDSESNGKVEIAPIDGLFNNLTEDFSNLIPTTSLANGMHVLYVRAMDAGGNWSVPAQATFIKDTTPPVPSIPVVTPNPTNNDIAISANAVDSLTNIAQAEYWIDAQTDRSQMAAADGLLNNLSEDLYALDILQNTTDGQHTVSMRAQDAAGNWSVPVSSQFIKDTMPPTAGVIVTPYYATTNIVLSGYAGDNLTNIAQAEYWIDAEASGKVQLTPIDGQFNHQLYESFNSSINILTLTDGQHTVYMRARDAANNWSEPVTSSFVKDAASPGLSIPTVTPDPTNLNWTPTQSTASDTISPINQAEYWIDYEYNPHYQMYAVDGTFNSNTEDIRADIATTGMADGPHTVYMRAQDAAGNWSASISQQFTVDKTPPTEPQLVSPSGDIYSTTPLFTWNPSQDITAVKYDFALSEQQLGGGWVVRKTVNDITTTSYQLPVEDTLPRDTNYCWQATATDAAGNTSTTPAPKDFCVKELPPGLTGMSPSSAEEYTRITTHFYGENFQPDTNFFVGTTPVENVTVDAEGMHAQGEITVPPTGTYSTKAVNPDHQQSIMEASFVSTPQTPIELKLTVTDSKDGWTNMDVNCDKDENNLTSDNEVGSGITPTDGDLRDATINITGPTAASGILTIAMNYVPFEKNPISLYDGTSYPPAWPIMTDPQTIVVDSLPFLFKFKIEGRGAGAVLITASYAPKSPYIKPSDDSESIMVSDPASDSKGKNNAQGDDILVHNGECTINNTDLVIPGRGFPLAFSRTYRSQSNYDGPLGYGWDFNYNQWLEPVYDFNNQMKAMKVHTGRGSSLNYDYVSGSFISPMGCYNSLHYVSVSDYYVIFEKDRSQKVFWKYGTEDKYQLSSIIDQAGNAISLGYYQGRLTAIYDTLGRNTNLFYNASNRIDTIHDFTGREIRYGYDANGDLVSVTTPPTAEYPIGKTTNYSYWTGQAYWFLNHNLKTITDPKGQVYMETTYDSNDRAIIQRFGQSNNFSFDYSLPGITRMTDRAGNNTDYYINSDGTIAKERLYTRGIRPGDPAFYETAYGYNTQGERSSILLPKGNTIQYAYAEYSNIPELRGNMLSVSRHSTGSDPVITNSFTYNWADVKTAVNALGKITTFYYDYEEATLGDQNGDGITNGADGNVVKIKYPDVTLGLGAASNIFALFEYNDYGQVTKATDPEGYYTTYEYYSSGPMNGYLQRVNRFIERNLAGPKVSSSYEYDAVGNITAIYDNKGAKTEFTVNALNQVTDTYSRPPVAANPTIRYHSRFQYDANGNIEVVQVENRDKDYNVVATMPWITSNFTYTMLDKTATQTNSVYDAAKAWCPASVMSSFGYDNNDNLEYITDPLNHQVKNSYDERGLLYETIRGYGTSDWTSVKRNYDANGVLQSVMDGRGNTTTFSIDGYGRVNGSTDAKGNVTELTLDVLGNVTRIVKKDNAAITVAKAEYGYDELNRVYETRQWLNLPAETWATSQKQYDRDSRLVRVVDPNSHNSTVTYDGLGRVTRAEDNNGNKVDYAYDANSNVFTVTESEKKPDTTFETFITTNTYDGLDRLIESTDNAGITRCLKYDSRGNVVYTVDGEGNTAANNYDGLGRLNSVVRDMRSGGKGSGNIFTTISTENRWDAASRLIAQMDPGGRGTYYEYDALNRLLEATTAIGQRKIAYSNYDGNGNAQTMIDGNGSTVTQIFDELNRMTNRNISPGLGVSSDTTSENFVYDALSRITCASNNASTIGRSYDSLSNLLTESQYSMGVNNKTVTSGYDAKGINRLSLGYPSLSRSVGFTPDNLDRIQGLSFNSQTIANYTYTGPGRVKERAYGNNTNLTVGYDTSRRVTNYESRTTGNDLIAGFEYAYDREDNLIYEKRLHENKGDAFVYDSIYRLTGVKYGIPAADINPLTSYDNYLTFDRRETFSLDVSGNRTWTYDSSLPNPETVYTPNDLNQYSSIQQGANPAVNLLYDINGNLTDDGVKTYKYDYANRLVEVRQKSPDAMIAHYYYDVFGRRVGKQTVAQTSVYFYDGARVIEETDQTGVTRKQYVFGIGIDEVLTMETSGGQRYYYHTNLQGSVYAVTDNTGNVVERYKYSAYGKCTILEPDGTTERADTAIGNRITYTGREYDAESGLYYYRARYYSAEMGRFISKDPLDDDSLFNAYAYVGNNPVNFADPMGLRPKGIGMAGTGDKKMTQEEIDKAKMDAQSKPATKLGQPVNHDEYIKRIRKTLTADELALGDLLTELQELEQEILRKWDSAQTRYPDRFGPRDNAGATVETKEKTEMREAIMTHNVGRATDFENLGAWLLAKDLEIAYDKREKMIKEIQRLFKNLTGSEWPREAFSDP
ncbi:MAG: SDR family NAD(P)-dependent oxidoreductase [Candidatus Brocadiia bacterium]